LLIGALVWPAVLYAQAEQMELVTIGERPVAYHVLGHAPGTPLLVINGGPGFAHGFLHFSSAWERLAEARRVVFFDQPGTGQSWPVGPNDSLVVRDILRSIEAIREAIGVPRVALLGHSWGGYVALAYALKHPDHVERVVLVASVSPKISATESVSGALFPERTAAQAGLSADNPDDVQTYIRGQLAMSFYSSEVRDRVLTGLGVVAYNGRQETLLWKDAEAHDLTGDLNRLRMPVLVTTGRFDVGAPRNSWRIHQAIPGSQFAVWERSGHFPMIEEPDAFFAVIDGFLRGGR
jgi:proline iminopeptidase